MIRLTSHVPRALAALTLLLTAACGQEPEVALAAPARSLDAPFVADGLAVTVATAGPGAPTRTFRAPAEVRLDATRRATVVARVEGVVTELFVGPGDTVAQGAPLCALESREVAAARSALLEAEQRADFAQAALAREERLLARDATSEREALDARRATQEADLQVSSAAAALRALGVDPVGTTTDVAPDRPTARGMDGAAGALEASDTIPRDAGGIARFVIHAPLSGRVLERPVALGEATTAERVLFELADL